MHAGPIPAAALPHKRTIKLKGGIDYVRKNYGFARNKVNGD